jgi:hypothetical protein
MSASKDKNMLDFVKKLSAKFYINEAEVVEFTNAYWSTNIYHLSLENLNEITNHIHSKSSSKPVSQSNSACSTPRMSSKSPDASEDLLTLNALTLKATEILKSKKKVVKLNKCIYKFKVGKNAGQECGVACADKYCAKHDDKKEEKKEEKEKKDKAPDSEESSQKKSQSKKEEKPRKLQKQTPAINPTEQFIQSRLDYIKFSRHDVLKVVYHPQTNFVYDEESNEIYGKIKGDEVVDLSADDIEYVKSMKLRYKLPKNLQQDTEMVPAVYKPTLEVEDDLYEQIDDEDE